VKRAILAPEDKLYLQGVASPRMEGWIPSVYADVVTLTLAF